MPDSTTGGSPFGHVEHLVVDRDGVLNVELDARPVTRIDDWAWIHVPGQPEPDIPPSANPTRAPDAPAQGPQRSEASAQGGETTVNFSGKVRAATIVGRDQTNYNMGAMTPRRDLR